MTSTIASLLPSTLAEMFSPPPAWTIVALAAFCIVAIALHLLTVAIAVLRCRPAKALPAPRPFPPVSIVRPVCGIDNFAEETLRSSFTIDHPCYEVIFCAARGDDPVTGIVRRLMAEYPAIRARLLVGDEHLSVNPKLNNVFKGWREAAHEWIVIADSNVLFPRDYAQRLFAAWRADTGLVCSPPAGGSPDGVWAELECAFLNTYQLRWQYFADTFGLGFAQGKTMLWRRSDLDNAGGLHALAAEVAEDAAATKVVRDAGLRVRLVDAPFEQPLGARKAGEVVSRQLRWARLRRASFPLCFLPEILTGGLLPLLAALSLAAMTGHSLIATAVAFAAPWYGAEMVLAFAAGWPISIRTPFVAMLRDLMLPAIWITAWGTNGFVWRGNRMRAAESARVS